MKYMTPDMSNVEILGSMSMIFKSQCQYCQWWLVIIDQRQWYCQCIEICPWLFTLYNRVNSSDLNSNVNSCIQSLTSLNVNDSKIVNSMSIAPKSICKWHPQLVHCSCLLLTNCLLQIPPNKQLRKQAIKSVMFSKLFSLK